MLTMKQTGGDDALIKSDYTYDSWAAVRASLSNTHGVGEPEPVTAQTEPCNMPNINDATTGVPIVVTPQVDGTKKTNQTDRYNLPAKRHSSVQSRGLPHGLGRFSAYLMQMARSTLHAQFPHAA